MLNRKHLRKQSLQFSRELTSFQWDVIKRMNLQQLLEYCRDDPDIATYQNFFLNIKPMVIEVIIRLVFADQTHRNLQQRKSALQLIPIIKGSESLLTYLLQDQNFDRMIIFEFMNQKVIPDSALKIFGDIFLTFSRNCPDKLLLVIHDQKIQHLFTHNMKISELYKTVYTMVFCLNRKASMENQQFLTGIIFSLLVVLFQDENGVSVFEGQNEEEQQHQQQANDPPKISLIQSNRQLSFSTNQNQQPYLNHLKQFSPKIFRKFTTKLDSQQTFQQYLEGLIQIASNITEMFGQLSQNLGEIYKGNVQLLIDIMNQQHYISKLFCFLNLVRSSIMNMFGENNQKQNFDQQKMLQKQIGIQQKQKSNKKLKSATNKKKQQSLRTAKQLFNQFQDAIYQIIHHILDLYTALDSCLNQDTQSSNNIVNIRSSSPIPKYRKTTLTSLGKIMDKVNQMKHSKNSTQIIQQLKIKLYKILKQVNQNIGDQLAIIYNNNDNNQEDKDYQFVQSSGLSVKKMRFSTLWLIRILVQMFQIAQYNQSGFTKLIGMDYILPYIQRVFISTLQINKWNNIVQIQLNKLFQVYIDNYYERVIQKIDNCKVFSQTILGIIVMSFRNKNHIFLNTMKMCKQGDQNFLFTLAKYISGKLSQKGDLKRIMDKYPIWKQFVHKDLKNYELILNKDSVFSQELFIQPNLTKMVSLNQQASIVQPLETIQQIIMNQQLNKRWSMSSSPPKFLTQRRRKQSFNSAQVIKQIDSLRNFQLNRK